MYLNFLNIVSSYSFTEIFLILNSEPQLKKLTDILINFCFYFLINKNENLKHCI
jgi:hypothetical protein